MARKTARKKPAKRKRAISKAHPLPVAMPLFAHPRLVHGFLVRLATVRIGKAGNRRPASMVAVRAGPRPALVVDVKHEGPGDDATFH
jgi:hypothetical protein